MKTSKTIYILAAFLSLQFTTLLAAGNSGELRVMSSEVCSNIGCASFVPVTPSEATFEDAADLFTPVPDVSTLAPVTPMIADFSEGAPASEISLVHLAPVTPMEADFEDAAGTSNMSSVQDLAPVTPEDADFEDHA